jgi:hypothetical protein
MRSAGAHAGGKGIEPPDAMRETVIDQELQRAVGDRRLIAEAAFGKLFQNLVGAHRPMRRQQDLQCPAPHRRQADAAALAEGIGLGKDAIGAKRVIMGLEGQRPRLGLGFGRCSHVILSHSA